MSRLIVKNLPDNIKETRLREIFSDYGGEITDIKLCFTKKGIFRKFAFIGYKTEQEASHAMKALHKTFINTSKITVESCVEFNDKSISRPWSKYSKGSSAFRCYKKEIDDRKNRIREMQLGKQDEKKKKKKGNLVIEQLNDIKNDAKFKEFLSVHSNKETKQLWSNENLDSGHKKEGRKKKSRQKLNTGLCVEKADPIGKEENVRTKSGNKLGVDDSDNEDDDKNEDDDEIKEDDIEDENNTNNDGDHNYDENVEQGQEDVDMYENKNEYEAETLNEEEGENKPSSDLDWLKTKSKGTKNKEEASVLVESEEEICKDQDITSSCKLDNLSSEEEEEGEVDTPSEQIESNTTNSLIIPVNCITIKMRGIPFKSKEADIINFFKPLEIVDIRFTKNKQGKRSGYAFVDFKTVDDTKKAMKKDKQMMKGRYIELFLAPHKGDSNRFEKESWNVVEDVSETGRLFIRNLSYTCTEEDLESLFSKYGNLVEVNLPIDKNSNKATGFAFVTFMMPEHALKAWTELDGKIFQGRILHIIPGKPKRDEDKVSEDSSFKKKKEAGKKALSGSAHNWNALFLGQNAIADVMAERLNTDKRTLLDGESRGSVAVRMALGETELVSETRKFLESHGVKLDVFGQANSARSKTVILVKNLPPGTTENEMSDIFSKHGDLGRVLMPPFGITAIIEFINAKDAKQAFQNLAYSKFKHTPLYLEWAPVDVLSGEVTAKKEEPEEESSEESDDPEATEGTVIFVKNLNFDTREDKLKLLFSSCGKIKNATIAKKKDPKKDGNMLSMGYGFVELKRVEDADKAIKNLQGCQLDGHKLELKKSHRETIASKSSRKRAAVKKQTSSKIVVRNIPFEANVKEVKDLFSTFGVTKSVRLPKKMAGTGSHRGFAFVDFVTKQDAKRAFQALCQSTHLYGRRLVLEWAEDDESVDTLREKTALHYREEEEPQTKKRKQTLISALEMASANEDVT